MRVEGELHTLAARLSFYPVLSVGMRMHSDLLPMTATVSTQTSFPFTGEEWTWYQGFMFGLEATFDGPGGS